MTLQGMRFPGPELVIPAVEACDALYHEIMRLADSDMKRARRLFGAVEQIAPLVDFLGDEVDAAMARPDAREPAWVDLGDGTAVDASLIWWIGVAPPQPLSWSMFPSIEPDRRRKWTVSVEDVRHVATTVGRYWDEASARAHARRIVDLMHTAANTAPHDDEACPAGPHEPPES